MHQEKSELEEMQSKIKKLEKLNTAEMIAVLTHAQQWEIKVSSYTQYFIIVFELLTKSVAVPCFFLNQVELGENKIFQEKKKEKMYFSKPKQTMNLLEHIKLFQANAFFFLSWFTEYHSFQNKTISCFYFKVELYGFFFFGRNIFRMHKTKMLFFLCIQARH